MSIITQSVAPESDERARDTASALHLPFSHISCATSWTQFVPRILCVNVMDVTPACGPREAVQLCLAARGSPEPFVQPRPLHTTVLSDCHTFTASLIEPSWSQGQPQYSIFTDSKLASCTVQRLVRPHCRRRHDQGYSIPREYSPYIWHPARSSSLHHRRLCCFE